MSKVFLPKARKQYSRNRSHGNTLAEVNCNRYLPSKFVPKIRHVIPIGNRAEGTKYAINIKLYMFWQSDFFGPFRQTICFRLMELSHLILIYKEKSILGEISWKRSTYRLKFEHGQLGKCLRNSLIRQCHM